MDFLFFVVYFFFCFLVLCHGLCSLLRYQWLLTFLPSPMFLGGLAVHTYDVMLNAAAAAAAQGTSYPTCLTYLLMPAMLSQLTPVPSTHPDDILGLRRLRGRESESEALRLLLPSTQFRMGWSFAARGAVLVDTCMTTYVMRVCWP